MDVHGFSNRMIGFAERLSDVADAAEGKGRRASGSTHWLVLPAVGAGLYALVRSDFFTTRARGVVDEAKTLATDLPNDLMTGVRQASQKSSPAPSSTTRKASSTTQRSASHHGSQPRRKASAAGSRKSRS
jgi:hypothetical protein